MDPSLIDVGSSAGLAVIVVAVAAWLRGLLAAWLRDDVLTRLMPAVVVLLAVAAVGACQIAAPGGDWGRQIVQVAALAMAGYSGGKAVLGKS